MSNPHTSLEVEAVMPFLPHRWPHYYGSGVAHGLYTGAELVDAFP